MSITDEIMGKAPDQLSKASDTALKVAKEAKDGLKDATGVVKGICLLLIKADFSEAKIMQAVRNVAYKKTGDIKYSKNNIDIEKLRKSGHVYKVEDNILAEEMGIFDRQCQKHGIKYSAMIDTSDEGKPDYKPSYMFFFEGKDDALIINALAETYKEYAKHQKVKAIAEDVTPQRESVKAKLAFFRDRVTARDTERDAVEKHHQHDDISR